MKTKRITDEIRNSASPETKLQMELSVAIANRISHLLEKNGWSQKDFAKKIGKTETEVCRWLSGTHNLTLSTISKISIALGEDVIRIPGYYIPVYEQEELMVAEPMIEFNGQKL